MIIGDARGKNRPPHESCLTGVIVMTQGGGLKYQKEERSQEKGAKIKRKQVSGGKLLAALKAGACEIVSFSC